MGSLNMGNIKCDIVQKYSMTVQKNTSGGSTPCQRKGKKNIEVVSLHSLPSIFLRPVDIDPNYNQDCVIYTVTALFIQ